MEAGPLVSELEDGCTFLLCGVDSAVLLDAYKEMLNVLKK
jgi:hypothetical protein